MRKLTRAFIKHKLALIGSAFLILFAAISVLAPVISPFDPEKVNIRERFIAPGELHILGTDELGRDVLSRVLHAGRTSLSVGIGAALLSVLIGSILGGLAGFFPRWADPAISLVIDTLLSIPVIALAMAASAFVELTTGKLILILALIAWPGVARIVRGQVMSLKEQMYVEAAHALGYSSLRILFRQILPNALPPITVAGSLIVALAILIEAALSFLGFGVPPPTPTWGRMLNDAQLYYREAPWMAIYPGLAITITVASINFLGEGLREASDPRSS